MSFESLGNKKYRYEEAQKAERETFDEPSVVKLNQQVRVTWHNFTIFKVMFPNLVSEEGISAMWRSLSPRLNRDSIFKAGEGAGRSGSFFFFSHDHKFIIKTMTPGEMNLFVKLLPRFKEHYLQNRNSLLARIYGVFTVKIKGLQEVRLMMMENTL